MKREGIFASGIRSLFLSLLVASPESLHAADEELQACFILVALNGSHLFISDEAECKHPTSPASTFKLPHGLIALETGVVADPLATVPWDGTDYSNATWEREHSLDSAIKWSALWFFQRTADLIGRERMLEGLAKLHYSEDSFEGEAGTFWLDGDLVVTPFEQMAFLMTLVNGGLPVAREHADALNAAFLMPPGKVTLASGEHDFPLDFPGLRAVHAKTGNARVGGESVSWLTGYFDTTETSYVFVARARSNAVLPPTAGTDLAARELGIQAGIVAEAVAQVDLNGDGRRDVFYQNEGDEVYELIDTNFDARVDEAHRYDANGQVISSNADTDFDGIFDTLIAYEGDLPVKTIMDSDNDGLFDMLLLLEAGEPIYEERYYVPGDGSPAQIGRIEYRGGQALAEEKLRETEESPEEFSARIADPRK